MVTVNREGFTAGLKAVALAVSNDPTRRNQRAVALRSDGKTLELAATNGHWLARGREPIISGHAAPAGMNVASECLPTIFAWLKARAKRGVVDVDFAGALTSDQNTQPLTVLSEEFPSCNELIASIEPEPEVKAPRRVALAGVYLAAIVKAFTYADTTPILRFGGDLDAVLITHAPCPLTCVLMPVRQ